jgi:DNA polymerase III delta prime subunit
MYNGAMKEFLGDLTHHAYFLVGGKSDELFAHLEKMHKIPTRANPDFFHEKYESLGINESRRLKELHTSKSFVTGSKKIFIIECKAMTLEAQNSLLKIFEEPHEHTHFFILMPSAGALLPTLRSRLSIFQVEREEGTDALAEARKFMNMSVKDRITYVDDIAKRITDEEIEKSDAIAFLSSLEELLATKDVEKYAKPLKAILKARSYMHDQSPSVKQLLEYVALSV